MASAAVAFTVDPFTPRDDAIQLNLRLENKRVADSLNAKWQHVREETVTLKDVNIVTQLNRAHYAQLLYVRYLEPLLAYRLSLRPTRSDTQLCATFPLYLEVSAQASSQNEGEEMCPPEIGAFSLVQQLQCQTEERQQTSDSTNTSHAAAMLGGTFVAALLMYSLLPYVRARNTKRRRSRSRMMHKDRLGWCSDQPDIPTTPNEGSRRIWKTLNSGSVDPSGAYRDGLRQSKSQHPEIVNGNAVSDVVSELLLGKLPDFNDERGWRDFFDSHIYHKELQDKQRTATKIVSETNGRGGRELNATTRTKRRQMKIASTAVFTARGERYRTIRDRIDRAAMEAAIDDAQSFNEFWQM